jgi:hypothetical protein
MLNYKKKEIVREHIEKEQMTLHIKKDIMDKIRKFSEDNRYSMSDVVTAILEDYVNNKTMMDCRQ